MAFTWGWFHRKCSRYLSLIWVWKLLIIYKGYSCISEGPKNSMTSTACFTCDCQNHVPSFLKLLFPWLRMNYILCQNFIFHLNPQVINNYWNNAWAAQVQTNKKQVYYDRFLISFISMEISQSQNNLQIKIGLVLTLGVYLIWNSSINNLLTATLQR